jgi:hypothetical protein
MDMATVSALLQKLQAQVQDCAQVNDLKAEQQSAKAESAVLRKELERRNHNGGDHGSDGQRFADAGGWRAVAGIAATDNASAAGGKPATGGFQNR